MKAVKLEDGIWKPDPDTLDTILVMVTGANVPCVPWRPTRSNYGTWMSVMN